MLCLLLIIASTGSNELDAPPRCSSPSPRRRAHPHSRAALALRAAPASLDQDRIGRVLCECVENVGDQQFLMLLLVMQPDFDNFEHAPGVRRRRLRNQPFNSGVDVRAIGGNVFAIGPRDQATLRPRMTRTRRNAWSRSSGSPNNAETLTDLPSNRSLTTSESATVKSSVPRLRSR